MAARAGRAGRSRARRAGGAEDVTCLPPPAAVVRGSRGVTARRNGRRPPGGRGEPLCWHWLLPAVAGRARLLAGAHPWPLQRPGSSARATAEGCALKREMASLRGCSSHRCSAGRSHHQSLMSFVASEAGLKRALWRNNSLFSSQWRNNSLC